MKLLLVATVLFGCQESNPNYCKGHPDNNCAETGSGGDGGGAACTTSAQCSGGTPVCDTGTSTCVPCMGTDVGACTDTTPICQNEACVACAMHAQCTSQVCLPSGACGSDGDTAWVSASGADENPCTMEAPCAHVSHALAATTLPNIFVTGSIVDNIAITRGVTILAAAGAKVTGNASGATITVMTTGAVEIDDLEISGGQGPSGYGVSLPSGAPNVTLRHVVIDTNDSTGIDAEAGTLTVTRSTLSGNRGGGLYLNRTSFDIENTFVTGNGVSGTSGSSVGGVTIGMLGGTMHTLQFDTIADNMVATGLVGGVNCASVTPAITVANNIIYSNGTVELGGSNCNYAYSIIGPDGTVSGTDLNLPPQFKGGGDYHIFHGSPARDHADPTATQPIDIDDDTRPMGTARDSGADETQ